MPAAPVPESIDDERIASALGGAIVATDLGPCIAVDRRVGTDRTRGRVRIDEMTARAGEASSALAALVAGGSWGANAGPVLFFDLETTGLAGGAGTYAFIVGCGWFDDDGFRTRQFFLPRFAAERAVLAAAGSALVASRGLVSFNGKTFDVPLLETRYLFHRLTPPFDRRPHLDVLYVARRLWTGEEGCALTTLETDLFGVAREHDVAGFEIPSRYFRYVRTGDVTPLHAVFEHNRLDLLALALLSLRVAEMLEGGPDSARTARECVGLGRTYERAGLRDRAAACYERATSAPSADDLARAEALRRLAGIRRRERCHDAAAEAWQQLLGIADAPSRARHEATIALAIHHEHRTRDLPVALAHAQDALRRARTESSAGRAQAAAHRLARLERKLTTNLERRTSNLKGITKSSCWRERTARSGPPRRS